MRMIVDTPDACEFSGSETRGDQQLPCSLCDYEVEVQKSERVGPTEVLVANELPPRKSPVWVLESISNHRQLLLMTKEMTSACGTIP